MIPKGLAGLCRSSTYWVETFASCATCSALLVTCSRRIIISSNESNLFVFGNGVFGTGTPRNEQSISQSARPPQMSRTKKVMRPLLRSSSRHDSRADYRLGQTGPGRSLSFRRAVCGILDACRQFSLALLVQCRRHDSIHLRTLANSVDELTPWKGCIEYFERVGNGQVCGGIMELNFPCAGRIVNG